MQFTNLKFFSQFFGKKKIVPQARHLFEMQDSCQWWDNDTLQISESLALSSQGSLTAQSNLSINYILHCYILQVYSYYLDGKHFSDAYPITAIKFEKRGNKKTGQLA